MIHLVLIALFHYINVPVVDMRETTEPMSEIVSQGYFSEEIKILESSNEWVKIETTVDHYEGWIPKNAICQRDTPFAVSSKTPIAKVSQCTAHIYHTPDTIYGPILTLPFDSKLEVLEEPPESNRRWIKIKLVDGKEGFIQRGHITLSQAPLNFEQVCTLNQQFLNLPYTWGGRSSFGYDCSGFVQMLYRQMGISLPRNSRDQAAWEGFSPTTPQNLKPGDLIFWGLEEKKIRHVGMYLGNDEFIHATVAENAPYIHISKLSAPEWNQAGKWTYRTFRTLKEKSES
jgi:hypothetical protein